MQEIYPVIISMNINLTSSTNLTLFKLTPKYESIGSMIIIDYGDGVISKKTITLPDYLSFSHSYSSNRKYTVRILGHCNFSSGVIYSEAPIDFLFINTKNFSSIFIGKDPNTLYIGDQLKIYNIKEIYAPNCPFFINIAPGITCTMPSGNEKFLDSNEANDTTFYAEKLAHSLDFQYSYTGNKNFPDIELYNSSKTINVTNNKIISEHILSNSPVFENSSYHPGFSVSHTDTSITLTANNSITNSQYIGQTEPTEYPGSLKSFLKIIYTDGTYDVLSIYMYGVGQYYPAPCFLAGTKITLADGSQKPVEDIKYDDLLLVYDFRTGKIHKQFPFFLKQEHLCKSYLKFSLENGEEFNLVGEHGIYDVKNKKLEWITTKNYKNFDFSNNFEVWNLDENGSLVPLKIVSVERIYEEKPFYSLITSGTKTCFTNGILTCGDKFWNDHGEITDEDKFNMSKFEFMKAHPELQYSYDRFVNEFGEISKAVYYGGIYDYTIGAILLANMEVPEEKHALDNIRDGVMNFWADAKPFEKSGDNTDIYYIGFQYKDGHIEIEEHPVGDGIMLPETETGWYNVCDTEVYKKQLVVNTSTVLEEI